MKSVVWIFFSSRRRHTRLQGDWSSDVCSSDLRTASSRSRPSSCTVPGETVQLLGLDLELAVLGLDRELVLVGEIGRASCRERVLKNVGGGSGGSNGARTIQHVDGGCVRHGGCS